MSGLLRIGTVLLTNTGQVLIINNLIGQGGQGQVYEVTVCEKRYALKWYYKNQATEIQRLIIEKLIKKGSPNSSFLWPIDIVDSPAGETFGYIMPIKSLDYISISEMINRNMQPTFRALCTAAINLADSYLQLHAKGLCYRDISLGNLFINPSNGEILICDNDNVEVTGVKNISVFGTQRFMAPEIIRGEAKPSTETDLFSLATLLFFMFMLHHPLEGKIYVNTNHFDANSIKEIYGYKPLFIWDPVNFSNRPVLGYQINALAYWDIYPEFIKELFVRAFTEGLLKPQNRVLENEWRKNFIKLRDSIVYCKNCGAENFYDILKVKNGETHKCWACKSQVSIPPRIKIKDNIVLLNSNSKIYPHHLREDLNFTNVVAEVTRNPKNLEILGLKNLSNQGWKVVKINGDEVIVEKGKSIALSVITKINFGHTVGEVRL